MLLSVLGITIHGSVTEKIKPQQEKVFEQNKVITIGVYEYEPYFMIDEKGQVSGYYKDLMEMLQRKHHLSYEFKVGTLEESIKCLTRQEIDILLGVPMSIEENDELFFSRYSTNQEIYGVFSDEKINLRSLRDKKNVTVGMVESDFNAERVIDVLRAKGIEAMISYQKDYKTLETLLENGTIDLMVANEWKQKDYHLVYEFIGRDIYIAGHKKSLEILKALDEAIESVRNENQTALRHLHRQYFINQKEEHKNILIGSGIILLVIMMITSYPYIRKRMIQHKIREHMRKDHYVLQYQPIYNPGAKWIVGFEGLIRLLDRHNRLIPPLKFIKEVENNGMLFEVSIWILQKVIREYDLIKTNFELGDRPFYISINVSLREIENEAFVNQAIDLLKESEIRERKVCLEIIERFKINDEGKIITHIKRLKEAGFIIAIDDFGVEYSNLDVFQKLDVDIVKVDKMLVDGIGKDAVKEEIVRFISRLAYLSNRCVILEGVEDADQDAQISKIDNDRLYVQGYYYSKPISIEID